MKVTLLLIASLFVLTSSFGQLDVKEASTPEKIGEIKIAGEHSISLSYNEEPVFYTFMFKNQKYKSINDLKSFSFYSKEDLESLYSIIEDNLGNKSKKELEIKLRNDNTLTLKFTGKQVSFLLWDGVALHYSAPYNLKQINKLFGK